MKKIVNNTHLEGYLFGHSLEVKEAGPTAKNPGVEYIAGTLDIVTDDEGLNVVPVNFRYVTRTTKAGKKNATFETLEKIIASDETWQKVGDQALKLKVDTALGLNDFYNAEGELVTYKLNDGGFVHIVNSFTDNRNYFEVDILITGTVEREADEDRGTPDMLILKGATFNFMGSILPVDLVVKDPGGMKWFESLGASAAEPVFTKVWGHVVCSTIETQTTEESAFGEAKVNISTRRLREWVVTGASTDAYDYGDEAVLTKEEVEKAIAAREVYLADQKKSSEEYRAKQGGGATATSPKAAGFNF